MMEMTTGLVWMAVCGGLFLAVVAAFAGWLALRCGPAGRTDTRDPVEAAADQARQLSQRRYAAGEIDEDEYFRRLSGLSQP